MPVSVPGASACIMGAKAAGFQPFPPTTSDRLKGSLSALALACIAPDTATTSSTSDRYHGVEVAPVGVE
eukprot:COSAG01_NODE_5791_length_4033_cov_4.156329_4_plen_69_part_00